MRVETGLGGNRECCAWMIAGNHDDANASLCALGERGRHMTAQWISKADQADQFQLEALGRLWKCSSAMSAAGDTQHAQPMACMHSNALEHSSARFGIATTQPEHGFGSALDRDLALRRSGLLPY